MFALCGFRVQIFMGSFERNFEKTAQKREDTYNSNLHFLKQRANFEEEDKREENTRKKRTRASTTTLSESFK